MAKTLKKSKQATVKVQPAATEAVEPAMVREKAAPPAGVVLEILSPTAKQVQVAGSFNEWKPERTPLVAENNGRWTGNLHLSPGRHEYLFVVDGQWLPDPNARESVENPFGGKNSVLQISR